MLARDQKWVQLADDADDALEIMLLWVLTLCDYQIEHFMEWQGDEKLYEAYCKVDMSCDQCENGCTTYYTDPMGPVDDTHRAECDQKARWTNTV